MDKINRKSNKTIYIIIGLIGCTFICAICVLLFSLLGGLSYFGIKTAATGAEDTKKKSEIQNIQICLEEYFVDHYNYPSSLQPIIDNNCIQSTTVIDKEAIYKKTGNGYQLSIELSNGEIYSVESMD